MKGDRPVPVPGGGKPVLVTGGAGFIGSNLADRLAALGHEVIVFDAIVKPEQTRLLATAEASGCRVVRGREMMRGQIARMVDFFGYPETKEGS